MARAIRADIEDPAQARIAEGVAENAIRPVLTVAGIAGVVVVAGFAALLYGFLPTWHTSLMASRPPSEALSYAHYPNCCTSHHSTW